MTILICKKGLVTPARDMHMAEIVLHEVEIYGSLRPNTDIYYVSKNRYGPSNVFVRKTDLGNFIHERF